jgi:hypothetical protein
MKAGRRPLFRIALVLGSTALTLVVVEQLLRRTSLGAIAPSFVSPQHYLQLWQGSPLSAGAQQPARETGYRYARDLPGTGGFPHPPGVFADAKAADAFRIFVFGGSTTFGLPFTQAAGRGRDLSFPAWLRLRLARRYPGRTLEVINVGAVGQTMEGAVASALECLAYQPDLLLFYSGHNEYLPHALLLARARTASAWVLRAGHALLKTRLGRLWQNYQVARQERANRRLGTLDFPVVEEMLAESYHSPAESAEIVAGYRRLLRLLADRCAEESVQLVVCTLACNLADYEPSLSSLGGEASNTDVDLLLRELEAAREAQRAGDWQRSLEALAELSAGAEVVAEVHYRRACAHAALGQDDAALQHFSRARDLDGVIRRAPTALNQVLRELCKSSAVRLVDVDQAMTRAAGGRAPGKELFYDHVHPTLQGTQVIVDEIEQVLVEAGCVPGEALAPTPIAADQELSELGYQPLLLPSIWVTQARSYGGLLLLRLYDPQLRLQSAAELVHQVPEVWPGYAQAQIILGFLEVIAGSAEAGRQRLARHAKETAGLAREFVERSGSKAIGEIFTAAGLLASPSGDPD